MLTPLMVRSPVPALYVKVPLMPLLELNGEHAGTEGSVMTGANALLVVVPSTVALPLLVTVVPAVALPVTWAEPDMATLVRVERTLPQTLPLLPIVIVPLLRILARLLFVAGYPPAEL